MIQGDGVRGLVQAMYASAISYGAVWEADYDDYNPVDHGYMPDASRSPIDVECDDMLDFLRDTSSRNRPR